MIDDSGGDSNLEKEYNNDSKLNITSTVKLNYTGVTYKEHYCFRCNSYFENFLDQINHSCSPYKCSLCFCVFQHDYQQKLHNCSSKTTDDEESKGGIECTSCKSVFETTDLLSQHKFCCVKQAKQCSKCNVVLSPSSGKLCKKCELNEYKNKQYLDKHNKHCKSSALHSELSILNENFFSSETETSHVESSDDISPDDNSDQPSEYRNSHSQYKRQKMNGSLIRKSSKNDVVQLLPSQRDRSKISDIISNSLESSPKSSINSLKRQTIHYSGKFRHSKKSPNMPSNPITIDSNGSDMPKVKTSIPNVKEHEAVRRKAKNKSSKTLNGQSDASESNHSTSTVDTSSDSLSSIDVYTKKKRNVEKKSTKDCNSDISKVPSNASNVVNLIPREETDTFHDSPYKLVRKIGNILHETYVNSSCQMKLNGINRGSSSRHKRKTDDSSGKRLKKRKITKEPSINSSVPRIENRRKILNKDQTHDSNVLVKESPPSIKDKRSRSRECDTTSDISESDSSSMSSLSLKTHNKSSQKKKVSFSANKNNDNSSLANIKINKNKNQLFPSRNTTFGPKLSSSTHSSEFKAPLFVPENKKYKYTSNKVQGALGAYPRELEVSESTLNGIPEDTDSSKVFYSSSKVNNNHIKGEVNLNLPVKDTNSVTSDCLFNALPDLNSGFLIKILNNFADSYRCPKCGKLFKQLKSGSAHYVSCKSSRLKKKLAVCLNEIEFLCTSCHYHCNRLSELVAHKRSCNVDLQSNITISDCLLHYETNKKHVCPKCSYSCLSQHVFDQHPCQARLEHMKTCVVGVKKLTTCDLNSVDNLTKFECSYCKALFFDDNAFEKHAETHLNDGVKAAKVFIDNGKAFARKEIKNIVQKSPSFETVEDIVKYLLYPVARICGAVDSQSTYTDLNLDLTMPYENQKLLADAARKIFAEQKECLTDLFKNVSKVKIQNTFDEKDENADEKVDSYTDHVLSLLKDYRCQCKGKVVDPNVERKPCVSCLNSFISNHFPLSNEDFDFPIETQDSDSCTDSLDDSEFFMDVSQDEMDSSDLKVPIFTSASSSNNFDMSSMPGTSSEIATNDTTATSGSLASSGNARVDCSENNLISGSPFLACIDQKNVNSLGSSCSYGHDNSDKDTNCTKTNFNASVSSSEDFLPDFPISDLQTEKWDEVLLFENSSNAFNHKQTHSGNSEVTSPVKVSVSQLKLDNVDEGNVTVVTNFIATYPVGFKLEDVKCFSSIRKSYLATSSELQEFTAATPICYAGDILYLLMKDNKEVLLQFRSGPVEVHIHSIYNIKLDYIAYMVRKTKEMFCAGCLTVQLASKIVPHIRTIHNQNERINIFVS